MARKSARSEINKLCKELANKSITNYSLIRDPQQLIQGLRELRKFVGNDELKYSVLEKVRYIIHTMDMLDTLHADHIPMINIMLDGSPGCGKSTVCLILGKILVSVGFLSDDTKSVISESTGTSTQTNATAPSQVSYGDLVVAFIVAMIPVVILAAIAAFIVYVFCGENKRARAQNIFILGCLFGAVVVVMCLPNLGTASSGNNTDNKTGNTKTDIKSRVVFTKMSDWTGQYLGESEKITTQLLNRSRGCVIAIDEAYELVSSKRGDDMYGQKVLTLINAAMSEEPRSYVFIFCGYREKLIGLYKHQPGLESRITMQLKCDQYTPDDLYNIYLDRLIHKKLKIEDQRIRTTFLLNAENNIFRFYGRDVRKLADECHLRAVLNSHRDTLNYQSFLQALRRYHSDMRISTPLITLPDDDTSIPHVEELV